MTAQRYFSFLCLIVVSVRTGQRDDDDDDNNYDEADGGNIRRRNPSSTSLERAGSSSFEIPQAARKFLIPLFLKQELF